MFGPSQFTSEAMHAVFDYRRSIDQEPILQFAFDDALKQQIATKATFEDEESHAAPEPSVGGRVRAENDFEYVLLYLQVSQKLLVFREAGLDREAAKSAFLAEMLELTVHRLPLAGEVLPTISPEPSHALQRMVGERRSFLARFFSRSR